MLVTHKTVGQNRERDATSILKHIVRDTLLEGIIDHNTITFMCL